MTEGPEHRSHAEPAPTRVPIVEFVFQNREGRPRRGIGVAAILAGGFYGLLAIVVLVREPALALRSVDLAAQIHPRLANGETIEVLPPPPARRLPPSPASVTRPSPIRTVGKTLRRVPAVAPAQAAAVITRVKADSPLDLTATTFVTGGAAAFPGGATAGAGRSGAPVAGAVDIHAPPAGRETVASPDPSRPVTLADGTWTCPWPPEADADQIDQQTVVIRVRVRQDGRAELAEVLSDPGHGFGSAATTCARRTRFQPARDLLGVPITSWSPPIRVHFSR